MKRFALLAAAVLGTGCVVEEVPPPAIPGWACPESGVDYVVVTYPGGALVDPGMPTIPCVYNYVQGATFQGFGPGTWNFVVTGYQNVQGGVAVYSSPVSVTVPAPGGDVILYWDFVRYDYLGNPITPYYDAIADCPYVACRTAHVAGIPDDLDIYANFVNANGSATIGTYCADPAVLVDTITYTLVDHAGTSVASGQMDCGTALAQAGIAFRVALNQGIDRDVYFLRAQGLVGGPTGTVEFDSATRAAVPNFPNCAVQSIAHYASDTGIYAWDAWLYDVSANLTFCP